MIAPVRRLFVPLVLLALTLFPPGACARGISIRGQEIQSNGIATGNVGKCSCTDQWYTVGLHPGTARIVATIKGHSGLAEVSYGIRVGLLRGMQTVGFSQAACLASQRHCRAVARITVHIGATGAYYVKVSGLGANGIAYILHIRGHIYRLR